MTNNETPGRSNYLGIRGWFWGGKYGVERYLYFLHRLTGVGILLYLVLHIVVTGTRVRGEAVWEATMQAVGKPVFRIGEFLVFVAFAFHALNGFRLILGELGLLLGKPVKPTYPYKVAQWKLRPLALGLMILAAVVIVLGGRDFFFVSK